MLTPRRLMSMFFCNRGSTGTPTLSAQSQSNYSGLYNARKAGKWGLAAPERLQGLAAAFVRRNHFARSPRSPRFHSVNQPSEGGRCGVCSKSMVQSNSNLMGGLAV
jgi:hypothetical protein